jgi:hypothetical protein
MKLLTINLINRHKPEILNLRMSSFGVRVKHYQGILSQFDKVKTVTLPNAKVQSVLLNNGITCNEIEWLKRTGHYLPFINVFTRP